MNEVLRGDCLEKLKELDADSVDLIATDPPYGYSFMGKDWDKAVPSVDIWDECLRVLKPGGFAFVMSAPRSDVCARMMLRLEEAGFNIAFTPIYWTYASGFPKAMNIGKMVDKRNGRSSEDNLPFGEYLKSQRQKLGLAMREVDQSLGTNTAYSWWEGRTGPNGKVVQLPSKHHYGFLKDILELDDRFDDLIEREEAEREVLASKKKLNTYSEQGYSSGIGEYEQTTVDITAPATDAAKALDGSYGGFQPKPAVEVIIVVMKPLSEKTYVDQALKNGKGIMWLDDVRVPTDWAERPESWFKSGKSKSGESTYGGNLAALEESTVGERLHKGGRFPANLLVSDDVLADHSRFFDLDAWAQTLPFLAVPKASKSEKNKGLEGLPTKSIPVHIRQSEGRQTAGTYESLPRANHHPTVKPLKLMSYLITLGSRPGDVVLDPFLGSGTTAIAAKELGREFIGIEREKEYVDIAEARLAAITPTLI